MKELFSSILINKSNLKDDETYVEYDEEAFKNIPIKRVVGNFESKSSPGKHDGEKLVNQIMSLYEAHFRL